MIAKQTMNKITLRVKKLSEKAILPTRGSPLSAGYDLSAAYDGVVPARGKALIKTDLAIACPTGTYGRIAPRSGLAWKKSIDVGAGVIDADYRGNVGVILFNFSDQDFNVTQGDRIAQLVLERISYADLEVCEDLEGTERGAGGFGSTGVQQAAEDKENQNSKSNVQKNTGNVLQPAKKPRSGLGAENQLGPAPVPGA